MSNHKLEIEFGRHKNVPREQRIRKCCKKSAVEDEFHFVFECEKYEHLRNNSHNILKDYFKVNTTNELKKKLLTDVMSLNDLVIIDIFSKHILKCFYIRDKSP